MPGICELAESSAEPLLLVGAVLLVLGGVYLLRSVKAGRAVFTAALVIGVLAVVVAPSPALAATTDDCVEQSTGDAEATPTPTPTQTPTPTPTPSPEPGTVTVSCRATGTPSQCTVVMTLTGWSPNSSHQVVVAHTSDTGPFPGSPWTYSVTVDATGEYVRDVFTYTQINNLNDAFSASVGDVSSGFVPFGC